MSYVAGKPKSTEGHLERFAFLYSEVDQGETDLQSKSSFEQVGNGRADKCSSESVLYVNLELNEERHEVDLFCKLDVKWRDIIFRLGEMYQKRNPCY
jgi:hypothetical protein